MARKRYGFGEDRIARFVREGRGRGEGAHYKPWLTTADVPSLGRVHRVHCPKTGRTHHLLSDNEYFALLRHWWDDDVLDIREQFPLDRTETLEIAALCGIKHPVDPASGALWVNTTDMVVTKCGLFGKETVAYAIKEASDLTDPRVCDKLDIERRYWERRSVPWLLWTDRHVKTTFTGNLAWILHSGRSTQRDRRLAENDEQLLPSIELALVTSTFDSISTVCASIDQELGYRAGTTIAAFRRLLAAKRIDADLGHADVFDMPASAFRVRGKRRT